MYYEEDNSGQVFKLSRTKQIESLEFAKQIARLSLLGGTNRNDLLDELRKWNKENNSPLSDEKLVIVQHNAWQEHLLYYNKDETESTQLFSSLEGYQKILEEERLKLKCEIESNFPNRFNAIEAGLAVKAQMQIDGITQPFVLIFMGPPSTLKSTILEIILSLPDCYRSDSFTPRSFVSHSANVKKEKLEKIDLLPRIKHKTLVTPELGTMFSGNQDAIVENFGMLTRILDGRGFQSDSGVHGQRGYVGDYYFTWLGAVVDIPHRLWRLMGNLGPRIYFYRLPEDQKLPEEKLQEIKKSLKENSYSQRLASTKTAIRKFWIVLGKRPDKEDGKVVWDPQKDDEETLERIVKLAMVLASFRAAIPTWHTNEGDSGGANYHFETPIKEDPSRASGILYNLAKGHALLYGRNYITKDDLYIIIPIVLSSAPKERVDLFRLLIENNGSLNTDQFMEKAKVSRATARKEMQKLTIMKLVDITQEEGTTKPFMAVKLKKEFNWFLSTEFKKYWNDFKTSHTHKNSKLSHDEDNLEKQGVCETFDSFFEIIEKGGEQ